jgi:hypothetical protein
MRLKRIFLIGIFLLAVLQPIWTDEGENIMNSIKAGDIFEFNKYLASAEMAGRLSGTEGYNRAAKWAREKFKGWGLSPLYSDFFQSFEIAYNETGESSFSLILPAKDKEGKPEVREMAVYKDYCPTLYSGFGEAEAEVVFAGYGITAPELGWDDYKEIDVKGKVVAILHGTPEVEGKDFSAYSPREPKLFNAKKHGVAALILIYSTVISGAGTYVEGLPMVMAGDKTVEPLFILNGYTIQTIKALLRDGHQISFPTGVTARIKTSGVHHPKATTSNVIGMIKGSDPKVREEYIIFGAHLDHIGPWPLLNPGANDNASGSAIVMKLAQAFSELKKKPKRSIVFALFAAEELGLLGSKHMVDSLPRFPLKPAIMVNFDMNGVGNSLSVSGAMSYPELYEFVQKVNEKYSINATIKAGEISPRGAGSDYGPFLEKGIAAYANWVSGGGGMRSANHSPEDSIYVISPQIMEDIARLYFMAGFLYANR